MIFHEQCRGALDVSLQDIVDKWSHANQRGFRPPVCPHCHAIVYAKDTIPTHIFADCITSITLENQEMLQLIATAYHHLGV